MDTVKEKVAQLKKKSLVKTWGDHTFSFILQTQANYEHLSSNLVAEAFEQNRVPIATKCIWKRIKDNRTYKMNDIKGNTYPLSADDIG
jgi:hypothetical protein